MNILSATSCYVDCIVLEVILMELHVNNRNWKDGLVVLLLISNNEADISLLGIYMTVGTTVFIKVFII
jgi:hypothetical protein